MKCDQTFPKINRPVKHWSTPPPASANFLLNSVNSVQVRQAEMDVPLNISAFNFPHDNFKHMGLKSVISNNGKIYSQAKPNNFTSS